MKEKKTELTFELSDLSYEELVEVYTSIHDFINYLTKLEEDINVELNEGGK